MFDQFRIARQIEWNKNFDNRPANFKVIGVRFCEALFIELLWHTNRQRVNNTTSYEMIGIYRRQQLKFFSTGVKPREQNHLYCEKTETIWPYSQPYYIKF